MPAPVFDLPENYMRAEKMKAAQTFTFPLIPGWNQDHPMKHFQERAVAWSYLARRGVLADKVGLGKTIEMLGLIQLLAARGIRHRTIVVTLKDAQTQWFGEILKFTDLSPAMALGTRSVRAGQYASSKWDVMITTYPKLLRDWRYILALVEKKQIGVVILDEGSAFRHHDTHTKEKVGFITATVPYIFVLDATPIQNDLLDFHSELEVLNMNVFGALPAFERRYVRRETVKVPRGSTFVSQSKIVGYSNMEEFRARVGPFVLRRGPEDPEVDAELPEVQVKEVWIDLPAAQREIYNNVRRGIVAKFDSADRTVQQQGRASFHHLQYACDTTWAFGQDPPISVKIDLIMARITGELAGEKVVIFSKFKKPIEHLMVALKRAGIRAERYTGDEDQGTRDRVKREFQEGDLQVLVGTTAIERAINLQQSAYMLALNSLWNPARMEQLAGRIRRIGSPHAHVFLYRYLCRGTIEESMENLLKERAALPGYVFEEQSDLFESLTVDQMRDFLRE